MIDRQQVIEMHRLLLGRDPDGEAMIEELCREADPAALTARLLSGSATIAAPDEGGNPAPPFFLSGDTDTMTERAQGEQPLDHVMADQQDRLAEVVSDLRAIEARISASLSEMEQTCARRIADEQSRLDTLMSDMRTMRELHATETAALADRLRAVEKCGPVRLARFARRLRRRLEKAGAKVWRELTRPFRSKFRARLRGRMAGRTPGEAVAAVPGNVAVPAAEDIRYQTGAFAGFDGPVMMILDRQEASVGRPSDLAAIAADFGYRVVVTTGHALESGAGAQEREGIYRLTSLDAASLANFVEEHGWRFDVVVIAGVDEARSLLATLRQHCSYARIIVDLNDLGYIRDAQSGRRSGDARAAARAEQTRDAAEFLAGRADLALVASASDEAVLHASVPGCRIAVLPSARTLHPPVTPFAARAGIGILADGSQPANVAALKSFLAEVWPQVHGYDPSITLGIRGANWDADLLAGVEGDVRIISPAEDLSGWLEGLRMSVVPQGLEAGAVADMAASRCAGLPCLAAVRAGGGALADGDGVLAVPTPEEMAGKIVHLHASEDLWRRLSEDAIGAAQRNFSIDAQRQGVRGALIQIELPVLVTGA